MLWWLYGRQGRVVTTATTWKQVEEVLWGEIHTLYRKARVHLPCVVGHPLQTELKVTAESYAVGASSTDPTALQGRHHRDLLVVVDEAPGVAENIHESILSLATGDRNCIVMVGNPTMASGTFFEAFRRPGWKKLHMSCLDHPNILLGREVIPGAVMQSWVDEAKQRWGVDSPVYASRVLGDFPLKSSNQVISLDLAEKATHPEGTAKALTQAMADHEPLIISVDVARYGDNKTVIAFRRGPVIFKMIAYSGKNTMETANLVAECHQAEAAQFIIVDEVGVGGGVVDRLLELGTPVVGYHSGRPAGYRGLFNNRRSEGWWRLRERFEKGTIWIPAEEALLADLTAPFYKLSGSGKIEVERKEELIRRGVPSSDYADAVMMAFAMDGDVGQDEEVDDSDIRDVTVIPEETEDRDFAEMGCFAMLPDGF